MTSVISTRGQSIGTEGADWQSFSSLSRRTIFLLGNKQFTRDMRTALPLIAADISAGILASICSSALFVALKFELDIPFAATGIFTVCSCTVFFNSLFGLYPGCGISGPSEFKKLFTTFLAVSFVCAVVAFAGNVAFAECLLFAVAAVVFAPFLFVLRPAVRHLLRRSAWWTQPVIILGDGFPAESLYDRLDQNRSSGIRPEGIVFNPAYPGKSNRRKIYVGVQSELEVLLCDRGVTRVALAGERMLQGKLLHSLRGLPHLQLPPEAYEFLGENVRLTNCGDAIDLHLQSNLTSPLALAVKRLLDLAIVAISAPAWLPVLLVCAIWVKLSSPGPVFFRQSRVGRYGRTFSAFKFRSMVVDADRCLREYLDSNSTAQEEWNHCHKLKNDPRITSIGNFLRKSSLDELPQIINVILGDMSLVGPRPIIDCHNYDREYIEDHPEVFEMYQLVRPGITGLWQISGRNLTTYKQRVYMDRHYLHSWTVMLDLYILWRTIKTAILREGAY